jgi:2-oxoglutarate dehydrogenase E1 component
MLLPHGYEGQGAEHSSARMERYLQLCARDNMFVANCTTPANFFHLLRRQMKGDFRKPLIVFTPKSLLRHPMAVSKVKSLTDGAFQRVIPDEEVKLKQAKTLVFCSGKFYYDLIDARKERERMDVAIVRLEQLFPLPHKEIQDQLLRYTNVDDVVWAQEEPRNMGAWGYLLLHLPEAKKMRPVTRRYYGSPAAGSAIRFKNRHQQVIDYVFDPTLDNLIRKKNKSS